METKETKKVCYLCRKFKGYYTKEASRFVRAKKGYCYKYGKIVGNQDYCEDWCNGYKKLRSSKVIALKVLSDLLTNISGIKQILLEAEEKKKINAEQM